MLASIRQAEREFGRQEESVTVLAVSKGQPAAVAWQAAALGMTSLGENYLQECSAKNQLLRESGAPPVQWHLLGHLQRNKAKRAAELFHMVESLDSLELARLLSRARQDQPRVPVLCEVELTGLARRTGFPPGRLEAEFSQLLDLDGIEVLGLMTVADPDTPGRAFSACRELLDRLRQLSGRRLPVLSMGMSGDFLTAIAEGSTEVRIGSLLFGARPRAGATQ